MTRIRGVALPLFAASVAAIGLLSLFSGGFALNWQPVPAWVGWRVGLAELSGAILLCCGVGLLIRRVARRAALILFLNFLVWLVLLELPRAAAAPGNLGDWLGVAETVMLVTGAAAIWTALRAPHSAEGSDESAPDSGGGGNVVSGPAGAARLFYALALPVVGSSHFIYAKITASMVPAYFPDRLGWAYLTGAAHALAGLALLVAVAPRLAATLEAVMISLFTLLVWVPAVIGAPASRYNWTAFFVSAALAAAAFAIAETYSGQPWGWGRKTRRRAIEAAR